MGNVANWDLFDIMFVHEDGYTNCLEYLYEKSYCFQKKLSMLIFNKEIEGLVFKTRTVYRRTDGAATKKDVPDIILYNQEYFAIIEVKVSASEGDNQTIRYYDYHDEMLNVLGINPRFKEFFFLTKYGTIPNSKEFKPLTWTEIGSCIDEEVLNELSHDYVAREIAVQLVNRINTLQAKKIKLSDNWIETLRTDKWYGAVNLYNVIMMLDVFKDNINNIVPLYWDGYDKGTNEYNYSVQITPYESWNGKTLTEVVGKPNEYTKCYQLHFEFKYNSGKLVVRLDYHLNPYYSGNDIKNIKDAEERNTAIKCNEIRQEIARKCKLKWSPSSMKYNKSIKKELLSILSEEISINDSDSIEDVLRKLTNMVNDALGFTNEVVIPMINNMSEG